MGSTAEVIDDQTDGCAACAAGGMQCVGCATFQAGAVALAAAPPGAWIMHIPYTEQFWSWTSDDGADGVTFAKYPANNPVEPEVWNRPVLWMAFCADFGASYLRELNRRRRYVFTGEGEP